jgi:lipopolysaccharide export LptBFGC system permease protein LptF
LVRLFFRRLWQRYVIRDFHPLVLFYLFALFAVILCEQLVQRVLA